jgi:hypothetical protein
MVRFQAAHSRTDFPRAIRQKAAIMRCNGQIPSSGNQGLGQKEGVQRSTDGLQVEAWSGAARLPHNIMKR